MISRRQLPVASPLSTRALLRGWGAALFPQATVAQSVAQTLISRFGAQSVALTDSGTSALVLALRVVAGTHGTVACPAYVCVDLIAGARKAGVCVRLYDVDPHTLSPDLDSLRRVVAEGVDAVVVAHLYGFPADVPAVRAVIAPYGGIPIIEDAAQQAGASLHGARAGSMGDVSILSFGRGKGATGGNGGALLALTSDFQSKVAEAATRLRSTRGIGDLVAATATWLLGRPSIYDIPASIPALHLGETIYHDAHEPASLSGAAAMLLRFTLDDADQDTERRRQIASTFRQASRQSPRLHTCTPIAGGESGYLRFPGQLQPQATPEPCLGIVRGYPRSLSEEPQLQPILHRTRESLTGAKELSRTLVTLPTHHLLTQADLAALTAWLQAA